MTRERRIGLGILAGGVLVALFVTGILLAQEASSLKYTIIFEDGKDIKKGDRVQMSGVDIGVVQSVVLHTQPTKVEVKVKIEPEHAQKVRADSTAMISSNSFPNVSGQKVVEIINVETDVPAPPLEDNAVVEGMNGWVELNAWKLKRKLSGLTGSVPDWTTKLALVQENITSSLEQVKEIGSSPQAQETLGQLREFAEKMRTKGQGAVQELWAEWPQIKEKVQPMLKELSDFGRHYIVDQIRYVMNQIEGTLKRWREEPVNEPPLEPAAPAVEEVPAGETQAEAA